MNAERTPREMAIAWAHEWRKSLEEDAAEMPDGGWWLSGR
jgi:hypothetical protein